MYTQRLARKRRATLQVHTQKLTHTQVPGTKVTPRHPQTHIQRYSHAHGDTLTCTLPPTHQDANTRKHTHTQRYHQACDAIPRHTHSETQVHKKCTLRYTQVHTHTEIVSVQCRAHTCTQTHLKSTESPVDRHACKCMPQVHAHMCECTHRRAHSTHSQQSMHRADLRGPSQHTWAAVQPRTCLVTELHPAHTHTTAQHSQGHTHPHTRTDSCRHVFSCGRAHICILVNPWTWISQVHTPTDTILMCARAFKVFMSVILTGAHVPKPA